MTIITQNPQTRNTHDDDCSIEYNRHSHMFDVYVRGEKIAEEACYGDGEASLLLYLALQEAEEIAADEAYRRMSAAKRVISAYPQAAFIGHREALQIDAPITAPFLTVCRPNGYTVHQTLNGKLGAVVMSVAFSEVA
jgi:hypothetical protein